MDKEGKFCGFIWFIIPKVIINIKKRAIMEIRSKKTLVKGEKANEENESDNEEMKEKEKERDDDSE